MVHSRLVESFLAHARKAPSLNFWWMPRKCYQFVEFLVVVEKMIPVGLSFWAEITLSYLFWGVIFPTSFYKSGKKACFRCSFFVAKRLSIERKQVKSYGAQTLWRYILQRTQVCGCSIQVPHSPWRLERGNYLTKAYKWFFQPSRIGHNYS